MEAAQFSLSHKQLELACCSGAAASCGRTIPPSAAVPRSSSPFPGNARSGINYQSHLHVTAVDVDIWAVHMP
jgi:hypothetical protein